MKKIKIRYGILLILVVILLIYCVIIMFVNKNLSSLLIAEASIRVEQMAIEAMNEGLHRSTFGSIDYGDLIDIEKNNNGDVVFLKARTASLNELSRMAIGIAQEYLNGLEEESVSISAGDLTGMDVFSGIGPNIAFSIKPVGVIDANYVSEFETAGINQTRHSISLVLTCSVVIILPSGNTKITADTKNIISEAIIVGTVPNTYFVMNGEKSLISLPTAE